jgi:hypothetical protein
LRILIEKLEQRHGRKCKRWKSDLTGVQSKRGGQSAIVKKETRHTYPILPQPMGLTSVEVVAFSQTEFHRNGTIGESYQQLFQNAEALSASISQTWTSI